MMFMLQINRIQKELFLDILLRPFLFIIHTEPNLSLIYHEFSNKTNIFKQYL